MSRMTTVVSVARVGEPTSFHPSALRTLAVWATAFVAIMLSATMFCGQLVNEVTIPGSDTQSAVDLLEEKFPSAPVRRPDVSGRRRGRLGPLSASGPNIWSWSEGVHDEHPRQRWGCAASVKPRVRPRGVPA